MLLTTSSKLLILAFTTAASLNSAALVFQSGPRPEVRVRIEAFRTALNGSADEWEAMAKEHFSPSLLAKGSAEQRRQLLEKLRAEFGTITVGGVSRSGPDAPIQLEVTGSKGPTGTIELRLETAAPFRITGLAVEVGSAAGDGDRQDVPAPPVNGSMSDDELARALDAYFTTLAGDEVFSGVALVAKNGVPIFEKAYGYADRANRVPNTPATRFNLASINKAFTQAGIDQLVARGKLSRSDTVGTLLPDYPQEVTRAATVDQLLQHTAGTADFFGDEFDALAKDRFRSNADYYRFVSRRKPLFAPGARYEYCNGCYITLGAIIERVSGMPYEQYIEENVFKVAGMAGAGAFQADAIVPNVAMGYTRRGGSDALRANIYMRGAAGSAAGGGYATAADLLAFDRAIRSGKLGAASGSGDGRAIAGGGPGTNAFLGTSPVWTVVVLTNLDPGAGQAIGRALSRALSR